MPVCHIQAGYVNNDFAYDFEATSLVFCLGLHIIFIIIIVVATATAAADAVDDDDDDNGGGR